jgi:hypothetical protein
MLPQLVANHLLGLFGGEAASTPLLLYLFVVFYSMTPETVMFVV